jgi:hypothetical protein
MALHIYKDFQNEDEKPKTFSLNDIQPGYTFVMLQPLLDYGSLLINYTNFSRCFIFNASLKKVFREAYLLLNDADSKYLNETPECFTCGIKKNDLLRCSSCKLAKYCSKV